MILILDERMVLIKQLKQLKYFSQEDIHVVRNLLYFKFYNLDSLIPYTNTYP